MVQDVAISTAWLTTGSTVSQFTPKTYAARLDTNAVILGLIIEAYIK